MQPTHILGLILLAALAAVFTTAQQSQIPSTPFVALNVMSNSAVGVNVALPISDGGSAINSYVVEWDTNPGVREVQTVQTTTINGSFEVQQLTTTAMVRPEVQVVTSKAQAVPEVQQIVVSGATGGYFFVALDTSASGGSLQYSGNIYVSYPASGTTDGRDAANIITAMANVDFGTVVTRTAGPNTGDYVYQVTFPPTMGDVPQMTVVSSSLTPVPTAVASTSTLVQGNVIGGTFRLQFEGQTTSSLAYDASANDVRLALEGLSTLGVVVVSRTGPDYQNGYAWTVTFADPRNSGNMPAIIPLYTGLTVSSVGAAVNMTVVSADGNQIGGTFTVSWTNQAATPVTGTTAPIAYNATAAQFAAALNAMSNNVLPTGSIAVTRSGPDGQYGYSWTVTFLENSKLSFSGAQNLFDYATGSLTGTGVSLKAVKTKTASGNVPIGGYFALSYLNERTGYLPHDASARAVADALMQVRPLPSPSSPFPRPWICVDVV